MKKLTLHEVLEYDSAEKLASFSNLGKSKLLDLAVKANAKKCIIEMTRMFDCFVPAELLIKHNQYDLFISLGDQSLIEYKKLLVIFPDNLKKVPERLMNFDLKLYAFRNNSTDFLTYFNVVNYHPLDILGLIHLKEKKFDSNDFIGSSIHSALKQQNYAEALFICNEVINSVEGTSYFKHYPVLPSLMMKIKVLIKETNSSEFLLNNSHS